MRTAAKAVTQKKAAQVEVSREITRKGSTMTQMTVGRMARERRWTKNMRLQRASVRTCTCWLRLLRITASFGTCSWKGVVFGASCAVVGSTCAVVRAPCAVVVAPCTVVVAPCAVVVAPCAVVVVSHTVVVGSSG